MAHAHTAHHDAAHTADNDTVLAAFLEQGALPDIAKRVNMSLAALVNWASEHADLLAKLHQLLATRCRLLATQLELAALSALATVSNSSTNAADDKLRERALERQRKAANAILRHRACLERTLGASPGPHAPPCSSTSAQPQLPSESSNAQGRMPNASSSLDALMPAALRPPALMPDASMPSSLRSSSPPKLTISQRLAARRLASLATS